MSQVISQVVPDGYKQTEVGIIPNDWKISKLGNIGKFKNGINKDAGSFGHGLPFINLMDVFGKSHISGDEKFGLIDSNEVERKEYNIKVSDVLFIRSSVKPSGVGLTSVALQDVKDAVYSGFMIRYRSKGELDTGFKKHCFYDSGFRGRLIAASTVSANTNINQEALKELQIVYPSNIKEQTAIANALSDVDALLSELEKLIAKKQAIKTATMQQLLTGKTRLPRFAIYADGDKQGQIKGTKPSELGEIPEDWDLEKVNGFTDCTAGGTPSTKISSYWGGNNPWMSSGELHLKRVYDVAERITDIGLESSSTKYIPKDSVLMGLAGQGKTRGTVAISKITLCTNQSIAAIFPSEKHSTDYLYYNLDHRYEELRGLSTGDGGRGGLNLSIIRNLKIPFPKLEEQSAIASTLSDMDEEIQALKQRLSKTRQIKQGMMQELLTGKTRLPFEKGDTKSQGEPDAN